MPKEPTDQQNAFAPIARALRVAAYHEAGHAVASCLQGSRFKKASIVPNEKEGFLGRVLGTPPKWLKPEFLEMGGGLTPAEDRRYRHYAEQRMIELFAGAAAESRYRRRRVRSGFEHDYHMATRLAVCFFGTSRIASAFLEYTRCAADGLIKSHWWAVANVAHDLLEDRELSHEQVLEAIRRGPKRGRRKP